MKFAGFWIRCLAFFIDMIFLLPLSILQYMVRDNTSAYATAIILGTGVNWLYFTVFESSKWQGTPGKRIVKIKVCNLGGQRIGFGRANARYFSKILSGLMLAIGYMMAGWTKKKQAMHDLIAGTLVIYNFDSTDNSAYQEYTFIPNSTEFIQPKSKKFVMAGFDSQGLVIRLTFDLADPKLENDGILVGRDSQKVDLYIEDNSVSRKHVKIQKRMGKLYIEDLSSTNGTSLNNIKLNPFSEVLLPKSAELIIGDVALTVGEY